MFCETKSGFGQFFSRALPLTMGLVAPHKRRGKGWKWCGCLVRPLQYSGLSFMAFVLALWWWDRGGTGTCPRPGTIAWPVTTRPNHPPTEKKGYSHLSRIPVLLGLFDHSWSVLYNKLFVCRLAAKKAGCPVWLEEQKPQKSGNLKRAGTSEEQEPPPYSWSPLAGAGAGEAKHVQECFNLPVTVTVTIPIPVTIFIVRGSLSVPVVRFSKCHIFQTRDKRFTQKDQQII